MEEENPFRVSKAPALPRRPSTTSSSRDDISSSGGLPSTSSSKSMNGTGNGKSPSFMNPRKPKTNTIAVPNNKDEQEERPSFNDNPPFGSGTSIGIQDSNDVNDESSITKNHNNDDNNNNITYGKSSTARRSNCCTSCFKIYCWQKAVKDVALSRNLSHTVLLVGGLVNFTLFILSCYLLNTPQPFTQHMLNWRIPLSFFTTIITSAAIGNSCLFQLRSLFIMALSLPVCGGLYFYCMVIDATAATARYDICSKLNDTVRSNDKGCLTNLYTTIVLLDFFLFMYCIYLGCVTWYHRKSLLRTPLTTTNTKKKGTRNTGTGSSNGEDNNNGDMEINVFRQPPPTDE